MRSQRGGIPLSGQTDMQLMTGIQNITTKYTDVTDIEYLILVTYIKYILRVWIQENDDAQVVPKPHDLHSTHKLISKKIF